MGITVWTYEDPRHIKWGRFEKCPQFCSTPELVNAIEFNYGNNMDKKSDNMKTRNQVTTVKDLVNALYHDWYTPGMIIKQIIEVFNLINDTTNDDPKDVKNSLERNYHKLVDCLRFFCEMGIDPDKLDLNTISEHNWYSKDQQYIIKLYKAAKRNKDTSFRFDHASPKEAEEAIAVALRKKIETKENKKNEILNPIENFDEANRKRVVLHGILQFTPSILAAVEDLNNAGIDVLLLFNYRTDFPIFYEGWKNIYDEICKAFGKKDELILNGATDVGKSYIKNYNIIYDMNDIASGCFEYDEKNIVNQVQCYEFNDIIEFTDYVSQVAEQKNKKNKEQSNNEEKEIFYSPSRRINNLLRIYTTGQNERFLDRPIGHFFVAVLKMWNPETNRLEIINHNHLEIRDCLISGLISEDVKGNLLNSYHMVYPFIENERNIDNVISKLNDVLLLKIRRLKDFSEPDRLNLQRIGYMNITEDNLVRLIEGLQDIKDAARFFVADFNNKQGSIAKYYSRVCLYITERVGQNEEMDDELRQIIDTIVARMQDEDIPENGTLHSIKATMENFVRSENENFALAKSNFYDFTQVMGKVSSWNKRTTNHFCFLSDQDLCKDDKSFLPWPLEEDFFETLIKSKVLYDNRIQYTMVYYEILKKNAVEHHHYKKFALFYGILFSDLPVKLSYVKNVDGQENEMYYMLRLMRVKVEPAPNEQLKQNKHSPIRMKKMKPTPLSAGNVVNEDSIRFAMCPYRYVVESIVQKGTIYRDRFLLKQYIKILNLENIFKEERFCNDIAKDERDIIFGLTESEKEESDRESADKLLNFNTLKESDSYKDILTVMKLYPKSLGKDKKNYKEFAEIRNNAKKKTEEDIKKVLEISNKLLQNPTNKLYCNMCAIKEICQSYKR